MSKLLLVTLAASAACTTVDDPATEPRDELAAAHVHYRDLLGRLQLAPEAYELIAISLAHEYRDLDDHDAASFAAEYAWTPSPGVLRERDAEVIGGPVAMAWGEQYDWPITPVWKPGRAMPSIAVVDVVARVEGVPVVYQALLTRDYPVPGAAETLSDPVLNKVAYAPGPEVVIHEFVKTDGTTPPVEPGLKVDPGIDQVPCGHILSKKDTKHSAGLYLSHCGSASDRLQVKYEVEGEVVVTCGAADATGACPMVAHEYKDKFSAAWRVCDDDEADIDAPANKCSGWYSTRNGEWQSIDGSASHAEVQVEWMLCASDVMRIQNEKGTGKAFVTRTQANSDTHAIGYAGASASQQVVTQDGEWTALPLVKIATGLTIGYYGLGTLFSAIKFGGWLVKFNAEQEAHSKIGPTAVSVGLTCPSNPIRVQPLPHDQPAPPPPPM